MDKKNEPMMMKKKKSSVCGRRTVFFSSTVRHQTKCTSKRDIENSVDKRMRTERSRAVVVSSMKIKNYRFRALNVIHLKYVYNLKCSFCSIGSMRLHYLYMHKCFVASLMLYRKSLTLFSLALRSPIFNMLGFLL